MKKEKTQSKDFKKMILKEYKKGNVVFFTIEGIMTAPLRKFIAQPAEGILYDLNRDKVTVLTMIKEGNIKWVNDYAVAVVITELKRQLEYLNKKTPENIVKTTVEDYLANARLIAAAPDMLDALIEMLIDGMGNYCQMPNSHRKTAKEYYANEIKIIEQVTGLKIEEVLGE